jgi:hypothetical protein
VCNAVLEDAVLAATSPLTRYECEDAVECACGPLPSVECESLKDQLMLARFAHYREEERIQGRAENAEQALTAQTAQHAQRELDWAGERQALLARAQLAEQAQQAQAAQHAEAMQAKQLDSAAAAIEVAALQGRIQQLQAELLAAQQASAPEFSAEPSSAAPSNASGQQQPAHYVCSTEHSAPRGNLFISRADKPAEGSVPDALQLGLDRFRPLALGKEAPTSDPQVCLQRVSHLEHCLTPVCVAVVQKQACVLHSKAAARAARHTCSLTVCLAPEARTCQMQ